MTISIKECFRLWCCSDYWRLWIALLVATCGYFHKSNCGLL